ncbi:hypothetical protein [uncultured Croceitalea sp.]|uniref:hypothetical protein n=1 Tax=uncultured Croceitalea sp. TaxID=1798908 RepID=UPI003305A69F
MKTIQKAVLLTAGFALIAMSCKEIKKETPQEPVEDPKPEVVEAPSQIISLKKADSLYINYSKRRAENIVRAETKYESSNVSFEPTRFVTFDLKVIKDYIKYIEQEAKNGGTEADSLRIYFANYGSSANPKRFHNTVFMLPTAKTKTGYGGIYIDEAGDAKLIRDFWKSNEKEGDSKSKASLLPSLNSTVFNDSQSLIMNFGHCCSTKNNDF